MEQDPYGPRENRTKPDEQTEQEQFALDIEQRQHVKDMRSLELGLLGRLFGKADEKPGNIVGLAIIVSFVVLVGVLIGWPERNEVIASLIGIIALALRYLFGIGRRN